MVERKDEGIVARWRRIANRTREKEEKGSFQIVNSSLSFVESNLYTSVISLLMRMPSCILPDFYLVWSQRSNYKLNEFRYLIFEKLSKTGDELLSYSMPEFNQASCILQLHFIHHSWSHICRIPSLELTIRLLICINQAYYNSILIIYSIL